MAQATTTLKVVSFVRGCNSYMDVWESKIGEKGQLKRKPFNKEDVNAVVVVREKASVNEHPSNK